MAGTGRRLAERVRPPRQRGRHAGRRQWYATVRANGHGPSAACLRRTGRRDPWPSRGPARVTNPSCAGVRSAAFLSTEEEMASKTESGRDVPVSGQSGANAPALYQGFDGQYIDGSWRPGKHGGVRVDTDPYSGATLAEMVMVAGRTRGGHAAFRIDHGGAPRRDRRLANPRIRKHPCQSRA